jgi:hypothetical protein
MIKIRPKDQMVMNVWADILLAHERVMRTTTIKQFDHAQKLWIDTLIEGAEKLKGLL